MTTWTRTTWPAVVERLMAGWEWWQDPIRRCPCLHAPDGTLYDYRLHRGIVEIKPREASPQTTKDP